MLLKGSAKEIADFIELLQKPTNLIENEQRHGEDRITDPSCKVGFQMLRGALWTKKLNAVNFAFILTERQTIAMKMTLILSNRILIGALITNMLNEKSRLHKNTAGKV